MLCYSGSAVTQASPQDVWSVWVDVARWRDGDVIESARLNGDFQQGSTIISKVRAFPTSTLTITSVKPPRLWVDESRTLGLRMTFEHVIEPGDSSTTITERVLISGPVGPIVGRLLRRRLEALFAASTAEIARRAGAETHQSPKGAPR